MDLTDAVRRRRMVRAFRDEAVGGDVVDGLIDLARRAPTAGNTQGISFVTLIGTAETARYWDVTLPAGARRSRFRWPGLVAAPALVVVLASPEAYLQRYGEADKAASGLGEGVDAWPVPYWFVDAGMAVEGLLLAAVDAGLGASFFGLFDHEASLLAALGVPAGWRAVGTVALGHPRDDEPGRSARRRRKSLDEVVHWGRW